MLLYKQARTRYVAFFVALAALIFFGLIGDLVLVIKLPGELLRHRFYFLQCLIAVIGYGTWRCLKQYAGIMSGYREIAEMKSISLTVLKEMDLQAVMRVIIDLQCEPACSFAVALDMSDRLNAALDLIGYPPKRHTPS